MCNVKQSMRKDNIKQNTNIRHIRTIKTNI